jgi:hypothetical protein
MLFEGRKQELVRNLEFFDGIHGASGGAAHPRFPASQDSRLDTEAHDWHVLTNRRSRELLATYSEMTFRGIELTEKSIQLQG